MVEKTDNLATLKISQEDHEWADDEQRRIKKAEGHKPTQAELFSLLRKTYEQWLEGAISSDVKRFSLPKESQPHTPSTSLAAGEVPVIEVNRHETGEIGSRWGTHKEAIEHLIYILEHGPPGMAEDIKGNLKWFALAAGLLGERAGSSHPKTASDNLEALLARADAALEEGRRTREANRGTESGAKPAKKRAG